MNIREDRSHARTHTHKQALSVSTNTHTQTVGLRTPTHPYTPSHTFELANTPYIQVHMNSSKHSRKCTSIFNQSSATCIVQYIGSRIQKYALAGCAIDFLSILSQLRGLTNYLASRLTNRILFKPVVLLKKFSVDV